MKNSHPLFDFLIKEYSLKNDAALSRALKISPMDISKIRKYANSEDKRYRVSARMMIIVHKRSGMSIEDIEEMVGYKIE